MRLRGWMLALLMAGSTVAVAMTQSGAQSGFNPPIGDQQYVPRLGSIMNAIQVSHQKLYLAGHARNWDLASFESQQLKASLAEAALMYSGIPVSNVTTLASRLDSLNEAIKARNSQHFAQAFGELTGGCNECHQSMERPFIVIRQPAEQPFGNQQFAPKGGR